MKTKIESYTCICLQIMLSEEITSSLKKRLKMIANKINWLYVFINNIKKKKTPFNQNVFQYTTYVNNNQTWTLFTEQKIQIIHACNSILDFQNLGKYSHYP